MKKEIKTLKEFTAFLYAVNQMMFLNTITKEYGQKIIDRTLRILEKKEMK